MEKAPEIAPEKTAWGLVLLLVGAGVVGAFQVGKAPPMLLSIRSELGMNLFLSGWILSLFSVIGFLTGSVAGALADSFGHRRLLLTGLGLLAMGSLVGSFAPRASLLLAARALEGLGFLIVVVAAPSFVLAAWEARLPFRGGMKRRQGKFFRRIQRQ